MFGRTSGEYWPIKSWITDASRPSGRGVHTGPVAAHLLRTRRAGYDVVVSSIQLRIAFPRYESGWQRTSHDSDVLTLACAARTAAPLHRHEP
jgi:hypothetical protein